MGRYLKRRKRGWYFVMVIPEQYREAFGGRKRIEESLKTRDENLAEALAARRAGEVKLKFLSLAGDPDASRQLRRANYEKGVEVAQKGKLQAFSSLEDYTPEQLGVELEADRIIDAAPTSPEGEPMLSLEDDAYVSGLHDGQSKRDRKPLLHRDKFELSFDELAQLWLESWKKSPDRKRSNTASQYSSAIRLFAEYWGNRTLREVTMQDAAEYAELLKRLPPTHGRGKLKGVPLKEVVKLNKDGPGLSSGSIRRHLGVLKQVWHWAKPLGHCSGDCPFDVKLPKVNRKPYLGWETGDLQKLFDSPPKRRDTYEAFFVAMFTGLRVSEIADLTWGQVREEDGVRYLQVEDAKTEAGHRKVPLHSQLDWLLDKEQGKADGAVFPTFNPEGPAQSRGGDVSKLFGAWKRSQGFDSRRYVFHSARKNVTRIMEEAEIPANVWARIIGHEPGFTYRVYNPHGLTLAKAKEIIELIAYPEVTMPDPQDIYGDQPKLPRAA